MDATRIPGPLERRCGACGCIRPRGWFRKAGAARWSSTCRECRRAGDAAHAAKRRGAGVRRVGRGVILRLLQRQGGVCACGCGKSLSGGFHVDHILAVARGGVHEESNLQLLTPKCNLRKGAR